jgi:hypothetical protein
MPVDIERHVVVSCKLSVDWKMGFCVCRWMRRSKVDRPTLKDVS